MHLYHNTENDLVIDVEQNHQRKQIIDKIKQQFSSFGYEEIYTPAFEAYDLYANMNGTVNKQEMIKTIDNHGDVLVLRPDITIPLTQQISTHNLRLEKDLRYFYVLDVFRQMRGAGDNREQTQAGVEYFGNPSPEADAEIIALAVQLLQAIGLDQVKIELGHAGFFGQIIQEMALNSQNLQELKQFIQAKNVSEIELLLDRLAMNQDLKAIVTALPFLYGPPEKVIKKAKQLPLSKNMVKTLDNLTEIYQSLQAYNVYDHIVVDLSLINHMDYYSDMIFQGFIEHIGKPILMGGRYNTLATQFGAEIPAIGFACDVDILAGYVGKNITTSLPLIDIHCLYEPTDFQDAVKAANSLREHGIRVVTYPAGTEKSRIPETKYVLEMLEGKYVLKGQSRTEHFSSTADLLDYLAGKKG